MGKQRLRVAVTDGRGRVIRSDSLRKWLVEVAPRSAYGQVVIALVSDQKMRSLNHCYQGIDRVTDVLSFQVASQVELRVSVNADWPCLGDIVIATNVAHRQAKQSGHRFGVELRILALHGLLHLLGYDHERDAGQMERLERRLRRKGGIR